MKRTQGFTVIEAVVVLLLLSVGCWLFFSQAVSIKASERDSQRKVAVNAMYYSLEEAYYPKYGYYPQTIDSKTLRSVDPSLFTDPDGYKIGDSSANYHYQGVNCSLAGQCKSYVLSADMELEAEYKKDSRRS